MTTGARDVTTGADRDLVLVTIDCWRHDALERMPDLRARSGAGEFSRAEAVCAAPATRGAFGAIFGGRHYPRVYSGFDEVRADVEPLAAVLSDAGYATGGFVGSNPFLSAWDGDFDAFWNDRLETAPDSPVRTRVRQAAETLRDAANFLRFRGRVPAENVVGRAREWYERQSAPRFLWVHLMDAHVPFFPGGRRALRTGPLSVYRSHWRFDRDPESLTDADRRTLRECYERSLGFLDDQLASGLAFLDDDAALALVGDHGEEFDHGAFGHARLYDETVRVPLLTRNVAPVTDGDTVRQIDLAATMLSALDLSVPEEWTGRPHDGTVRGAFMLNHSPQFEEIYAGLRTEQYKVIRTTDAETGRLVREECYDLRADPDEQRDLADGRVDRSEDRVQGDLARRLDDFLDDEELQAGIRERPRDNVSAVVEDRLDALGYK